MQGMKIDFVTNTIIITKAFSEAANKWGSEKYTALKLAKSENPQMRVVLRDRKAGTRQSDYKGLTYKYMRRFISVMDSTNLINFEKIKNYYEDYGYETGSVYKLMREWFLDNYPEHRKMIIEAVPKRIA